MFKLVSLFQITSLSPVSKIEALKRINIGTQRRHYVNALCKYLFAAVAVIRGFIKFLFKRYLLADFDVVIVVSIPSLF